MCAGISHVVIFYLIFTDDLYDYYFMIIRHDNARLVKKSSSTFQTANRHFERALTSCCMRTIGCDVKRVFGRWTGREKI